MRLLLLHLFFALAFPIVEGSKLGSRPHDSVTGRTSERAKIRHGLVREKLISEMKNLKKKHHGPVFHSRDLREDNEEDAEEEGRTVIVECSQKALFMCSTCASKLQDEQDSVWQEIVKLNPDAELVSSTHRLVNALYVKLPSPSSEDEAFKQDNALRQIEGVREITPHGNLEMEIFPAVEYVGGHQAREGASCASGRDVRVAVLDGGIDYTHYYLGGEGTPQAFEDAYGRSYGSQENRRRDGLFPTEVVVDGYDFIGELALGIPSTDEDPIDSFGHGTAVGHAILTVAPSAKLVAIKVCGRVMSCPIFAIIRGLEFALDPDGDDDIEDRVDIVNLSLGIPFVSPFYNFVAAALETVFALGVLPIVSAGNSGNIPYVLGGLSGSPNSISVGATGHPEDALNVGVMANYSSRGPGENSMLAPSIVAPSGLTLAAAGTGRFRYRGIQGTSFSAPLVAGAAALVMDRCPECSPFAIKSLLMNNANRDTRYNNSSPALSPITWSGAGELQVGKTLQADFWAYSVEDSQASLSLGLIDAASNVVITRTIKVINLSDEAQALRVSYQMRNPAHPYANALTVQFNTPQVLLEARCNSEATVEVTFTIAADQAPTNHMTSSGGGESFDPEKLDTHEFGGHIVLESTSAVPAKDISVPFVAIIRSASDVALGTAVLTDLTDGGVSSVNVDLENQGTGTAQVDAYQLLFASGDDPESSFGESVVPNDFRNVGYRVLEVGREDIGCSYLVEFAFNTWERKNGRLVSQLYGVDVDLDGDGEGDRFLFNTGLARENYVSDLESGDTYCTGMPPDHGTSSTNTILRACAEEMGISDFEGQIGVRFEAVTVTHEGFMVRTDASSEDEFIMIDFPRPGLSSPSFDLAGGATVQTLQVDGNGVATKGEGPLGLMLVTNSYRNANSTGAAVPSSETLVILREGYNTGRLPTEITPDVLEFPVAEDLTGPQCSSWNRVDTPCDTTGLDGNPNVEEEEDEDETLESPLENEDSMLDPIGILLATIDLAQRQEVVVVTECPKREVPRASVSLTAGVPVTRDATHPSSLPVKLQSSDVGDSDPSSTKSYGQDGATVLVLGGEGEREETESAAWPLFNCHFGMLGALLLGWWLI